MYNPSQSSQNSVVTHIGIRTHSLDPGKRYLFDALKIGSSWSDVVPAQ
ncbi:MAG: hypothetical protein GY719_09835 [bacterium]|nr:hypothetical protein [bacterium]